MCVRVRVCVCVCVLCVCVCCVCVCCVLYPSSSGGFSLDSGNLHKKVAINENTSML